jgi:hypothetical protein
MGRKGAGSGWGEVHARGGKRTTSATEASRRGAVGTWVVGHVWRRGRRASLFTTLVPLKNLVQGGLSVLSVSGFRDGVGQQGGMPGSCSDGSGCSFTVFGGAEGARCPAAAAAAARGAAPPPLQDGVHDGGCRQWRRPHCGLTGMLLPHMAGQQHSIGILKSRGSPDKRQRQLSGGKHAAGGGSPRRRRPTSAPSAPVAAGAAASGVGAASSCSCFSCSRSARCRWRWAATDCGQAGNGGGGGGGRGESRAPGVSPGGRAHGHSHGQQAPNGSDRLPAPPASAVAESMYAS